MLDLGVIILNYNTKTITADCLTSIRKSKNRLKYKDIYLHNMLMNFHISKNLRDELEEFCNKTERNKQVDEMLRKHGIIIEKISEEEAISTIKSLDTAKQKATSLGFNPDGTELVETVYLFKHDSSPASLNLNIVTGIFSISYKVYVFSILRGMYILYINYHF